MTENNLTTATTENKAAADTGDTRKAPATSAAEATTPSVTVTASQTEQTASNAAPVGLPAEYLKGGYYATTESGGKYLRGEYVEGYAKDIAASLKGMKPGEFEKMVRGLKKAKKRTLPYEARRTAAAELLPIAKNLVRHKKAPAVLVAFIEANLAEIRGEDTWEAFVRHAQAILGLME